MMQKVFTLEDLIRVAKRENNTKRSYLYVNPVQGKHIPAAPEVSLELFSQMAKQLEEYYQEERLLVIGFAETATAIGTAIAVLASNADYYMSTTREDVPGSEYLFFTESHSHATEQRLAIVGLEEALEKVDRIVFAEDEVTTGNTIEKLIHAMRKRFPDQARKFGIISILNSMSEDRIRELRQSGVECHFVQKIPTEYHIAQISRYTYEPLLSECIRPDRVVPEERIVENGWNSRVVCRTEILREKCRQFCEQMKQEIDGEKVLILGTEECMFPGMYLAAQYKKSCPDAFVRFHATTRSPIEISLAEDYPLHQRYPLVSLYEEERRTFVYNLDKYDQVLIVTDAAESNQMGKDSLTGALESCGNQKIMFVKWRESSNAK